jgi:hypothetical protein
MSKRVPVMHFSSLRVHVLVGSNLNHILMQYAKKHHGVKSYWNELIHRKAVDLQAKYV